MEQLQRPKAIGIVNAHHPERPDLEAGLLPHLPFCRGRRHIPNIGPAARHRPAIIGALAHQQQLAILEHRAAHIHARGGVTDLGLENILQRLVI